MWMFYFINFFFCKVNIKLQTLPNKTIVSNKSTNFKMCPSFILLKVKTVTTVIVHLYMCDLLFTSQLTLIRLDIAYLTSFKSSLLGKIGCL